MKVAIYKTYLDKKSPSLEIYAKILEYNKINFKYVNIHQPGFWDSITTSDLFIFKWANEDNDHILAEALFPVLEESLKINLFPDLNTCWHYDDKIKQYYLLLKSGTPVVPTHVFWDKKSALEWLPTANFPLVFKLTTGASSSNVVLVKTLSHANKLTLRMFGKGIMPGHVSGIYHQLKTLNFNWKAILNYYLRKIYRTIANKDEVLWRKHKNYIMFQDFLDGNDFDTRVTTIGTRVHAFRRFVRKNDFRASGAETWDINPDKIDKRMLKIALDTSKQLGFQSMAYDFIYDANKNPLIVEISYSFGQPGYPDFMNGYWDENLNWIEGRFWPHYFELKDALKKDDLVCPLLEIPPEWKKNSII
jgi:hypothetical protein